MEMIAFMAVMATTSAKVAAASIASGAAQETTFCRVVGPTTSYMVKPARTRFLVVSAATFSMAVRIPISALRTAPMFSQAFRKRGWNGEGWNGDGGSVNGDRAGRS